MQKNYFFTYLFILMCFIGSAQITLVDQPVAGTSGIVTDNFTTDGFGVYTADDFNLTDSYNIEVITAYGFQTNGDLETTITGLDVFIYSDNAGVPSSDPTASSTGLLEIINLDPANPALTIISDEVGSYDFEIDVAAASGSSLTLTAGTYWLVVAPYVAEFSQEARWNWHQATDGTLSGAQLIDPSNTFGAGATWGSIRRRIWPRPRPACSKTSKAPGDACYAGADRDVISCCNVSSNCVCPTGCQPSFRIFCVSISATAVLSAAGGRSGGCGRDRCNGVRILRVSAIRSETLKLWPPTKVASDSSISRTACPASRP